MKTTADYILALQKKLDLGTPYAIAKYLGIAPSSVYRYLAGEQKMDDYTALKVAQALELNPLEVIAATNAERAKNEKEKAEWTKIFKLSAGRAAAILVTAAALLGSINYPIPTYAAGKNFTYYVKLSQAPGFDRLPLSSRLQNA